MDEANKKFTLAGKEFHEGDSISLDGDVYKRQEIGSVGATGMHSRFFENTVAELIAVTEGESELKVRRALSLSLIHI